MITAQQLYDTYPHKQMRMYINAQYPDGKPALKAARLGALVKKFLFNFQNDPHGGEGWNGNVPPHMLDEIPNTINEAFIWEETPEGMHFWAEINRFRPDMVERPQEFNRFAHVGRPVEVEVERKPVKKRVGWWV